MVTYFLAREIIILQARKHLLWIIIKRSLQSKKLFKLNKNLLMKIIYWKDSWLTLVVKKCTKRLAMFKYLTLTLVVNQQQRHSTTPQQQTVMMTRNLRRPVKRTRL